MKQSELKFLIKQLTAVILTAALVLTLAPAGIRVAKAAGEVTVKSAELVNPQNDEGLYTFYKDFSQNAYIATGSRIRVTYAVDGEEDYTEDYYVDSPSDASTYGDMDEDEVYYITEAYGLGEDEDDSITVQYDKNANTVYAHVTTEDDENGTDFKLYQPVYKELSEMPVITKDDMAQARTVKNCGYTQYYRLDSGMAGLCADIRTKDTQGTDVEDDPMLELYEKVSGASFWDYVAVGDDSVETGDYNDRLVWTLKEDTGYVLGVSNSDYENQVFYQNEDSYATFSFSTFVSASGYQVKVQDGYSVYPQFAVYPCRYDVTKADQTTETAYGTGSYVTLKDGTVANDGTSSKYTGLDGSELSASIDADKIKTIDFSGTAGELYQADTKITVPAGTQKLVYMQYNSTVNYTLTITGGEDKAFLVYLNEAMAKSDMYHAISSGQILYYLPNYKGTVCYMLLENDSDQDAVYQIAGDAATVTPTPTVNPSGSGSGTASGGTAATSQPGKSTSAAQTKEQTAVSYDTSVKGQTTVVKKIKYKAISEKTAAVVGTTSAKKLKKVVIPATVKIKGISLKVTTINSNAFKNCKKLKSVKLGKNVKSIQKNAFKKCKKLKKVTITAKKTKIAKKAFKGCKKIQFKVKKAWKKSYKKTLKKAKIGCKYSVK